ncbi:50S ribosomal protein L32 [bacterium]|nr:50S ribosomal protein L32 [bacterium]MCP5462495.1 50S ribosomal protein L32 [bacterium]
MANPKKRMSKMRRNTRRSHDSLVLGTIATCANCGASKLPHRVCSECGFYSGKMVIEVEKGV